MGTYGPTEVSTEESVQILIMGKPQDVGCAYVMYSLSEEYIVPPFKLICNNDVLCSAPRNPMASFDRPGSKQLPFSPFIKGKT